MTRNVGVLAAVAGILLSAWCGGAWGNSVTVSLVNPGSATVTSGTPFELRVVASISGARLSAAAYTLSVTTSSGDARAWLNRRSPDPNEANGLTYISQTVQFPFENNLAHNFRAGGQAEVMADMDYGDEGILSSLRDSMAGWARIPAMNRWASVGCAYGTCWILVGGARSTAF